MKDKTEEVVKATTEAGAVAQIMREAALATPYLQGPGWCAAAVPEGFEIKVIGEEHRLPQPPISVGNIVVHDVASFMQAIHQRRLPERPKPAIYADETTKELVAVLDDDFADSPGWRQYRVTLGLRRTPEWAAWRAQADTWMTQEQFAEMVEERAQDFREPAAATMLELAQSIEGTTTAKFRAGVRLQSGARQVLWEEQTEARAGRAGDIQIPDRFTLGLQLFIGGDLWPVEALLRYSLRDGRLRLLYKLVRPHVLERKVFDELVDQVTTEALDELGSPIIRGTMPLEGKEYLP